MRAAATRASTTPALATLPLALMLALTIAACAALAPPADPLERVVLSQLPNRYPKHHVEHSPTLLVLPPETTPPYDTAQMAYSVRAHEIAYFGRYQWGAAPSRMLLPLLTRTLERICCFAAVLTPPYSGPYGYTLRTDLLQLLQDFSSGSDRFVLSLRARLTDAGANRVIATRSISVEEPIADRTPAAGVAAANAATAKALQQVADFVADNIDASHTGFVASSPPND